MFRERTYRSVLPKGDLPAQLLCALAGWILRRGRISRKIGHVGTTMWEGERRVGASDPRCGDERVEELGFGLGVGARLQEQLTLDDLELRQIRLNQPKLTSAQFRKQVRAMRSATSANAATRKPPRSGAKNRFVRSVSH